jgi:hypothetical protein
MSQYLRSADRHEPARQRVFDGGAGHMMPRMSMRLSEILVLLLVVSPAVLAQQPGALSPGDPVVRQLTAITRDFEHRARVAGSPIASASPGILVDTPPQISMFRSGTNTIHTSRWEELPPDVQEVFRNWAGYAGAVTGQQLFDDLFHRFFFVHELVHWLQRQAKDNTTGPYQFALEANRVTVAYWREQDSAYLTTLLARCQRIRERLPSPVTDGQDPGQFFNANRNLGSKPNVYGWFQTGMVVQAGAERPFRTFSEALRALSVGPVLPMVAPMVRSGFPQNAHLVAIRWRGVGGGHALPGKWCRFIPRRGDP